MSRRFGTSHMRSSEPASRQESGGLEPIRCSCARRRRRSLLWYTFLTCITLFESSLLYQRGPYRKLTSLH